MRNKKLIIIVIISGILVVAGLVTSYIDSARVRNSMEPKFAIKIITDGGNKVTYWGLGYKVIRYPGVSPHEPFKNSLGVKYGNWFMQYELANYENIEIELLMDGKTIQVSKKNDVEFIISLLKDSKYINETCKGINTHKITIGDDVYYLKEGCSEIQRGDKQAVISKEDLERFLEIVEGCGEN